jgi:hypothetical protein
MSDEQGPSMKIRATITLGALLLGEYWRAEKIAYEQGLEPPPLPENLEEALEIELGMQVIEVTPAWHRNHLTDGI